MKYRYYKKCAVINDMFDMGTLFRVVPKKCYVVIEFYEQGEWAKIQPIRNFQKFTTTHGLRVLTEDEFFVEML